MVYYKFCSTWLNYLYLMFLEILLFSSLLRHSSPIPVPADSLHISDVYRRTRDLSTKYLFLNMNLPEKHFRKNYLNSSILGKSKNSVILFEVEMAKSEFVVTSLSLVLQDGMSVSGASENAAGYCRPCLPAREPG
jgi:hypothetical protein